ncbi:MAG: hypothetical protein COU29_04130 [Candidatus Magasanikbacteria bacterium CG10_big_fil_rev_8_21_14_0_10_36_32]|uniref:Glycosyltransferase RgtA/B/C/D-like domain-containing protein n=1 Tax=Candidatus Magasanikbacteria bacterium CG10_big_fil_rev_8_21_14_0_10_36_32 TaxID=1974646 RepID=A0A2M6W5W7_9BACT|nr:MAG: hypothetical protein COU29_04130 [Candidatus Magasanikbacteria bacterium CG10_big_fil_rev_8_21_14_0_10_36_32]
MFVQYSLVFCWGIVVLFAFIGYGKLLGTVLSPKNKFDLGMQAAFGMALSIVIGGILNLVGIISIVSIKIFVVVGILLFLIFWLKNLRSWPNLIRNTFGFVRANKIFSVIAVTVFVLITARYCFSVAYFDFHISDDKQGYLAFSSKMIQTGSLGEDPFSQHRVESSLGAPYFLQAIILADTSVKNLHLPDRGVGYLVLLLLLIGFVKNKKIGRWPGILLILAATVVVSPVGNVTACYTAAAMFFLFLRLTYPITKYKSSSFLLNALALAFPIAALCALKSSFISVAVVLFIGHYFIYGWHLKNFRLILKELIITVLIILVFLLPWMLSMLGSSGTLLYPILGYGYQGTAYGAFPYVLGFNLYSLMRLIFECLIGLITLVPLAILGIVAYGMPDREEKKIVWLVCLSSLVGILTLIIFLGGYGLYYYSFPYVFPSILFITALLLGNDLQFSRFPNTNGRIIGFILVAFLIGAFLQKDLQVVQDIKGGVNIGGGELKFGLMNTDLISEDEHQQYIKLQNSVPAGETIVVRLDKNFLFDFKRNTIYINDTPGGSSLPPGLPLKNGSEAMADYFLFNDIKYLAFPYSTVDDYHQVYADMMKEHVNPVLRSIAENDLAYQDYLMELSKTRKVIYDDGINFVLDISIKVNNE